MEELLLDEPPVDPKEVAAEVHILEFGQHLAKSHLMNHPGGSRAAAEPQKELVETLAAPEHLGEKEGNFLKKQENQTTIYQ